jgi:hypothetical protein
MFKLVFAATMFAASASAADFRALDFGQSCVWVPEWELAHGSTPAGAPAGNTGPQLAYTGREFDRDLYFFYFCRHGKLFSGNYFFPIVSLEHVSDVYSDVYTRLLSTYGEASADNSPVNRGDLSFSETDLPNIYTNWRTSRVSVTLAIRPDRKGDNSGWRIVLVVFPADIKAQVMDAEMPKSVTR